MYTRTLRVTFNFPVYFRRLFRTRDGASLPAGSSGTRYDRKFGQRLFPSVSVYSKRKRNIVRRECIVYLPARGNPRRPFFDDVLKTHLAIQRIHAPTRETLVAERSRFTRSVRRSWNGTRFSARIADGQYLNGRRGRCRVRISSE